MADQTVRQEQVSVLPEYQEKYLKDLLASTQGLAGQPTYIPEYQVAGLAPGQQAAIGLGYSGVGSYMPMLQQGMETAASGVGATGAAIPLTYGSLQMYDPNMAQQYMDPYQEEVIGNVQRDILRQAQMQEQNLGAQGVAAGAYGGARQGVMQAELGRAAGEQLAKTTAGLRSAGYQQAIQQSQQAFADQQRRMQSGAQLFGQLGQGLGSLGMQQAALGEAAQTGQQRDINALLSLGGLQQQQAQSELDAYRNTMLQRQYEPYQRVSFMSDIFRGVPSTQTTLSSTTSPSPSFGSQVAGLGLGIAGLNQAGLFNFGGQS
jgi:hypothetical protein